MMLLRDEFLSEEDLDLRTLTTDEVEAVWNAWLERSRSRVLRR